jgi:hypothetical protein
MSRPIFIRAAAQQSGHAPLFYVLAPLKSGTDGKSHRVAAISQQVVEQVIVHEIPLDADAKTVGENDVNSAPKSVKGRPVLL